MKCDVCHMTLPPWYCPPPFWADFGDDNGQQTMNIPICDRCSDDLGLNA